MSETPLLSDRDFELAPRPEEERHNFDLQREENINPNLWEAPTQEDPAVEATRLAESSRAFDSPEMTHIPEHLASTYLLAWGRGLTGARREALDLAA